MFTNRRKSRIIKQGPLPGNQSIDVNSNALAAASAIGEALKTGQPIPRSNSLQRTHDLQKRSFNSITRAGSLVGLQKSPSKFQEPEKQTKRTQSMNTIPKPIQRKSTVPKPNTIKKHVPGPYGLVTIEVPAEENTTPKPLRKPKFSSKRTSSLMKPPTKNQFSDVSSTHSVTSTRSSKRATFTETPLIGIQEKSITNFKESSPLVLDNESLSHNFNTIEEEGKFKPVKSVIKDEKPGTVEEAILETSSSIHVFKGTNFEEIKSESNVTEDFKELEQTKLNKEAEVEKNKVQEEVKAQKQLNGIVKGEIEEPKISKIVALSKNSLIEEGSKDTFVQVADSRESLDEFADAPSTAKSLDTDANQSSFTTQDTEPEVVSKSSNSNMAQQLRSTIQPLYVNQEKVTRTERPKSPSFFNGQGPANSISSFEKSDDEIKKSKTLKSALKSFKSTSNAYLPREPSAANDAYLSLTTAENTRMNSRIDESILTKGPVKRSSSINRQSKQPQQFSKSQNLKKINGNVSPPKRPASVVEVIKPRTQEPTSAQNNRHQKPQTRPLSYHPESPSKVPQKYALHKVSAKKAVNSTSGAATLNASIKKEEQPELKKKSSFEKERPRDKNAAFKRMSLREPTIQGNLNVESSLGFYRNQVQHQPPTQTHSSPVGLNGFKSRFSDSDSDLDVPLGNEISNGFADPSQQALRKPKSYYTLRSSSVNSIPEQSPAKSLPENRGTRYFSEVAKDQSRKSKSKKEAVRGEQEKKKSFGGKLKKLFGRSSKE